MNNLQKKAVYDFSVSPITFDFCNFLAHARLALAGESTNPIFDLHLKADKWRNVTPREKTYSLEDRLWRLHNLILPLCSLAPALRSVFLSYYARDSEDGGSDAFVSTSENYLPRSLLSAFHEYGYDPHLFVSPIVARQHAEKIFGAAKRPVVVSSRNSGFEPARDTPSDFFEELVESLVRQGCEVFVIPDQEAVYDRTYSFRNVTVVVEAAFNLPLRLALHESAMVGMCTCSGPTSLLTLAVHKPNLVVCYPIRQDVPIASREYFVAHGFFVGAPQPLPYIPKNQVWIWDTNPSAQMVCDAMLSLV